eukprot:TRINITY_DN21692_c0_g1_i1.p1 TRINITY_DN21692_c0_g1~~TRINITY_DN21692_c0_g1_i1.p1  ORF type:complete len:471 (+),score=47.52 TRINITY_DN21692_c0_g1_i1:23-1414(+)
MHTPTLSNTILYLTLQLLYTGATESTVTLLPNGTLPPPNTVSPSLGPVPPPVPSPPKTAALLITKLLVNPSMGNTQYEYVELWNPSEEPVDLTNYAFVLRNGTSTFWFASGTVPPQKAVLVCHNAQAVESYLGLPDGTCAATWSSSSLYLLGNSGGTLSLQLWEYGETDFVAWNGGFQNSHPDWDLPAGRADMVMARQPMDFRKSLPSDFVLLDGATSGQPSAGPLCQDEVQDGTELGVDCGGACEACPHQPLLISKLFVNPPGNDLYYEWIELYNPSNNTVNLVGWSLLFRNGTVMFELDAGVVEPRSSALICHYPEYVEELYHFRPGTCTATWPGGIYLLPNDGGTVALMQAGQPPQDFVAWNGGYEGSHPNWAFDAGTEGQVLARQSTRDTHTPRDWLLVTQGDGYPSRGPLCVNNVKDGQETGVDCGGPCAQCKPQVGCQAFPIRRRCLQIYSWQAPCL